jgi:hypothetical protein
MLRGVRAALPLSIVLVGCRAGGSTATPVPADVTVAVDGRADGAGTVADPVDAIARGLALLKPGETLHVTAGRYVLEEPVEVSTSGVRIEGEDGAVLDAREIAVGPKTGEPPFEQDEGAFRVTGVDHVVVHGLTITDSHNAGLTVRNSDHIEIAGNRTRNTFSSGIAVWSSTDVTVTGNEVVRASDESQAPPWFRPQKMVAPHEAITGSPDLLVRPEREDVGGMGLDAAAA